MKKLILLLLFPLLGMPAFAQQKKKQSTHKRGAAAVVKKKKEPLPDVVSAYEPVPPRGPVAAPLPENGIYSRVEQFPEFPGGQAALMNFLGEHLRYPAEAIDRNVEGRVIVRFVVSKTGDVTDVVIMRDIGSGCGKEAVRVVRMMPRWKPGVQNGRQVSTYCSLPVTFKLEDEAPVPEPVQ